MIIYLFGNHKIIKESSERKLGNIHGLNSKFNYSIIRFYLQAIKQLYAKALQRP